VYSFGVVLLEIITGQSPSAVALRGGNLVQWVNSELSGDIRSIVDPMIQDKYDVNSVWKAVDLACKCTKRASSERPTMSVIVSELKESLDIQISMEEMHSERSVNSVTDISQNSISNMPCTSGMPWRGPDVR
jgi:hypothetical protein